MRSPWLRLVKQLGITTIALIVLIVVGFIPIRLHQLVDQCQQDAAVLHQFGLSVALCAGYLLTVSLLTFVAFVGLAMLLIWRKPGDWFAIYSALELVALGAVFTSFNALVTIPPLWSLPVTFVRVNGTVFPLVYLYLFPDGRFVPRWTWLLALGALIYTLLWAFFPTLPFAPYDLRTWPLGLMIGAGWIGLGVLTQVYRYRSVATPTQRQQTKWILFATMILVLALPTIYLPVTLWRSLQQPGLPRLFYTLTRDPGFELVLVFFLSCCILSLLRYRLWDIDIIIRGTLIYSVLTALLALIYFGGVVLLQSTLRSLTGQGQNQFVTVLSTLAIAVLFTPLRRRVQDGIDRRFYRRKYNAEQVLAAFSATVRSETDLDKLATELLTIVEETLQPTHVSLWLRKPESEVKR